MTVDGFERLFLNPNPGSQFCDLGFSFLDLKWQIEPFGRLLGEQGRLILALSVLSDLAAGAAYQNASIGHLSAANSLDSNSVSSVPAGTDRSALAHHQFLAHGLDPAGWPASQYHRLAGFNLNPRGAASRMGMVSLF